MKYRIEHDFLGSADIPQDVLYGIHAQRGAENFPDKTVFNDYWYRAMGIVKLACFETYRQFIHATESMYGRSIMNFHFARIDEVRLKAMMQAAREISEGKHREYFIVPAISGGAGTSINMNINEIIVNRAMQISDKKPGDYSWLDPVEHANIFQSTNDVVPTALRVAVMRLLESLEKSINENRASVEQLESKYRNVLRLGYTQMQEAVPTTFGRLFSTYSDALSRDWWRISKAFERIKVVNLGGSAIGTGLTVPRFFIMEVVPTLQKLTGLPLTRGENLADATSNLDSFVEVHAILKAHAVNLEKIVSDLRLLSSDIFRNRALTIPKRQAGSSIMPGKVNPVIPEFIISIAHKIFANDMLISSLSAQGTLELNAYLPLIGHSLLESLQLLVNANDSMNRFLIQGIEIQGNNELTELLFSPSVTTVLIPHIGYKKATEIALIMKETGKSILVLNSELSFISNDLLSELLKPHNITKLGYSLKDIQTDDKREGK